MSASATAIDTVIAIENAVMSQMTATIVAPNITIECYRGTDGAEEWTLYAGDHERKIAGPAPSFVQAVAMLRKRA